MSFKKIISVVFIIGLSVAGGYWLAQLQGTASLSENGVTQEAASQDGDSKDAKETALEHAVKHADPNYVCPMHPQIVRDEPGTCPICGMDLVEKAVEKKKEKEILYWVAPMDPNYRRDKPGKSPMGMDLVPVYAEEEPGTQVTIEPHVVQNLGVRSEEAWRGKLWRRIDTVGYIGYDEDRVSHVHQRTDGWIEKLYVKAVGDQVKRGQLLYELYSPTIINAQEDYLQVLRSSNLVLRKSAEKRLETVGFSRSQIKRLRETRKLEQTVKTYAPQDGFVADLNVREGMYIQPATEVMTLVDLSSVWVQVEVYESEADWVKAEQFADMTLPYLPGKLWEGRVDFVYPELDAKTRTLRARVQFDNPDLKLKPNMYANIAIYGGPKSNALIVPASAVIRSGKEERVIIDLGNGEFAARDVVAGIEVGDHVEIKEGLSAGEKVVVSGQFLIDSEASLKASLMRMQPTEDTTEKPVEESVAGSGVVKALKLSENKLTLDHAPIEALGWPSMVMDFALTESAVEGELAVGDKVMFQMQEGDNGYVITSIHSMGAADAGEAQ